MIVGSGSPFRALWLKSETESGAFPGENDWDVAHRVLLPAFGPISMLDMFPEMHDICSQLILKWSRLGPEDILSVTEEFTRLTLDSIALCAMDTRFNSFYRDDMHPFVQAMVEFLSKSGERSNRPPIAQAVMRGANQRYKQNIVVLKRTALEVIQQQRNCPSPKKDLLNAMIQGRDSRSGEYMSEESIVNNIITFLIAGVLCFTLSWRVWKECSVSSYILLTFLEGHEGMRLPHVFYPSTFTIF